MVVGYTPKQKLLARTHAKAAPNLLIIFIFILQFVLAGNSLMWDFTSKGG